MLAVPTEAGSREEKKANALLLRQPSRFARSVTLAAVPFSESAAAAAAAHAATDSASPSPEPNKVPSLTMKKTKSEKEYNPGLRSMLYGLNFRKDKEAANQKKLQKKVRGEYLF
ncbi:hypothetical protein PFISCL1PPCAC_7285, partial [Pristionchus fissidentatus]